MFHEHIDIIQRECVKKLKKLKNIKQRLFPTSYGTDLQTHAKPKPAAGISPKIPFSSSTRNLLLFR